MQNLIHTYLGQYDLVEVLGRGSTATIYKAYQSSLGRYVAVKVLFRNLDPQATLRFEHEARAVALLQHQNILPIYDYGQQDDYHYFVMQYIENGLTLGDIMANTLLEPLRSIRLMLHVLSALDYAHKRGVIHRDIKPSNILMPMPDWPLLADFGIAKLIDASQHLTPPGLILGTAIYLAPERALNRPADARTDIYSVGIVLYEMLTGQAPFEGNTPVAVLRKHVYDPPPPPRTINPAILPTLEAVLLRALEKDPAARYQQASEMAQELKRVADQIERTQSQTWMLQQLQPSPIPVPAIRRSTTPPLPPVASPSITHMGGIWPFSRTTTLVLALLVTGVAFLLGLVFGWPPTLAQPATIATGTPTSGANSDATAEAQPSVVADLPTSLSEPLMPIIPLPTVTRETEVVERTPSPQPTAPEEVVEEPLPAPQPTAPEEVVEEPLPTPQPTAPEEVVEEPPVLPVQSGRITIRFENTDWQGGYSLSNGRSMYGGRSATWIYGRSTRYSVMQTTFELPAQPVGMASLRVEGMDSEGPAKTPIRILVNGVEIYTGPNPLPDDDLPLESGTWAAYTWSFDGSILQPERNEIRISNGAEGAFSLPPFFMLDYAELVYELP